MKVDLKDRIAVITGSAQGIGKACAKVMLENGATVIISDIDEKEGKKTLDEFSPIGSCEFIRSDVSSLESCEKLVETVAKKYGRIDIFVNNAGINARNRVDVNEFTTEDWERVIGVDLNGVFYCSRAVSKVMISRKSGRIVNIGSVLGDTPARKQIAYVTAKSGVHKMTKAMALELAPHGINVNGVAPGSTLTDATRKLFYGEDGQWSDMVERMLSHVPLGRPGDPEDIANAVLFLCADESKYITGEIITVDGGWTCGYMRDF